jgi:hypothetical protein
MKHDHFNFRLEIKYKVHESSSIYIAWIVQCDVIWLTNLVNEGSNSELSSECNHRHHCVARNAYDLHSNLMNGKMLEWERERETGAFHRLSIVMMCIISCVDECEIF